MKDFKLDLERALRAEYEAGYAAGLEEGWCEGYKAATEDDEE